MVLHIQPSTFAEKHWNQIQKSVKKDPLFHLVEAVALFVLGYCWWGVLGFIGTLIMTGLLVGGAVKAAALYVHRDVLRQKIYEKVRRKQTRLQHLQQQFQTTYGWAVAPANVGWDFLTTATNFLLGENS